MQSYLFQVLVHTLLLYDVQTVKYRSVAILQGGRPVRRPFQGV